MTWRPGAVWRAQVLTLAIDQSLYLGHVLLSSIDDNPREQAIADLLFGLSMDI